ncbi:DMT family transporter [Campylobacter sp. MIT 21-1685]|uniref:DMT family transporter n=1 Tax=unclassified Campylobacter TaxID=2593542 RepID=UPI00224B7B56|nr:MULTISPECIES: DMT family transporter [unclassified Campylobacter]MCX2682970.1 DMT family transporter [Campylobacter sp. MIT 21-1684]MCX2751252.1 DMT family transporter [Campylobacter sp. MIT 21-1682]MCX2807451.1 DMT family transporter [Campylobacter sp. MIT 21-1685]
MLGVFLVLSGGISWAISGILAEYLFKNYYTVEWISFCRLFFSGIFLSLLSIKKRNLRLFLSKEESFSLVFFAFFGLLLTQYSYFKAISYTDAGTATMIQYSAPLFIMLFLCFKEKKFPKRDEIIALFLIFVVLFFLASGGDFKSLNVNFLGLVWGIIAAFGIVFYSLSARTLFQKYGLFCVMGFASLISSLFLFILLGPKLFEYQFSFDSFLAMGGIIFIGTIMAFCLYLKGLEYIGAVKASMIACIEPVAAACMSFFFFQTPYTWLDVFSFVLIIISVLLNARKS